MNKYLLGFSRKQQQVCVVCCLLYGMYLCGISIRYSRQALVGFSLAEPDSPERLYYIEPPIHINTASYEELQLLPSIGPILAERILDYRDQHGPFTSIESLQHVKGIGPKTVQKLHHYLKR